MDKKFGYYIFGGLLSGALWGLSRVARNTPEALLGVAGALAVHLRSGNAMVQAVAVRLLGLLGDAGVREQLAPLENDPAEVDLFESGSIITVQVRDLAAEALAGLKGDAGPP